MRSFLSLRRGTAVPAMARSRIWLYMDGKYLEESSDKSSVKIFANAAGMGEQRQWGEGDGHTCVGDMLGGLGRVKFGREGERGTGGHTVSSR